MKKILARLIYRTKARKSGESVQNFSPSLYLAANTDVADAGVCPERHYLIHGWREQRICGGWESVHRLLVASRFTQSNEVLVLCRDALIDVASETRIFNADAVYKSLDFTMKSDSEYVARVARIILIPVAHELYRIDLFGEAERLVHIVLVMHGYRLDTEEAFFKYIRSWATMAVQAGRRFAKALPVPHRNTPNSENKILTVGFITRGAHVASSALDHILPICRHIAATQQNEVRAIIYSLSGAGGDLLEFSGNVEIKIIDFAGRLLDEYAALKIEMGRDRVDVACYVHAFDSVYFLFGMRLAPIQIQFSQYLHAMIDIDEIDEYITWGTPASKYQCFANRQWRVVPSCAVIPSRHNSAELNNTLRRSTAGDADIVLATFGRSEKINQPGFLTAVINVLKDNSGAIFLWTGQIEHSSVTATFKEAGVLHQTRYIGWVDVSAYVQIIDILLDSFPLANGLTAIQAMSEGIPVVSIWNSTSLLGRDIAPVLNEKISASILAQGIALQIKKLFPVNEETTIVCRTIEEYINLTNKLITDSKFRTVTGKKLKVISDVLYSNVPLMGNVFCDHIREIGKLPPSPPPQR